MRRVWDGAGSLYTNPQHTAQVMDGPDFPDAFRQAALFLFFAVTSVPGRGCSKSPGATSGCGGPTGWWRRSARGGEDALGHPLHLAVDALPHAGALPGGHAVGVQHDAHALPDGGVAVLLIAQIQPQPQGVGQVVQGVAKGGGVPIDDAHRPTLLEHIVAGGQIVVAHSPARGAAGKVPQAAVERLHPLHGLAALRLGEKAQVRRHLPRQEGEHLPPLLVQPPVAGDALHASRLQELQHLVDKGGILAGGAVDKLPPAHHLGRHPAPC